MEQVERLENQKKSNIFINTISIVVPLVVVLLLSIPKVNLGEWTRTLVHVIGAINALTSGALVLGLILIKLKKIKAHQAMMTISFGLGAIFLVCYVIYHLTNPTNKFTGEGFTRYVYFFTLITHIGFSFVVLPLVLRAMFYAATGQIAAHRKIARYAYPIWLYVSVTGVMVYLFVYQFFPAR